ncbi:transient receptor potential cation channel protein painless-like [Drosophila innubila]|uniref:transient receptor potential cation channel protein painless-like n=1 Tax=Drosophila innubila TaxID=198719 RepID=UPI00148CE1E3|nr:transient receptor potential cation channel protein painless-like [Drosophila innubila]
MCQDEFDAQKELWEAFEAGDLDRFHNAIILGGQPNLISNDNINNMSIYEKVLSKSGSAKFIRDCINAGCDVNYVNPQLNKAAINYAAESKNPQNLSMLLHQSNCKVNLDHQFKDETPLNALVKSLTPENVGRVFYCISILLHNGASPNLADRDGKTPLQIVLQLEKIPLEPRCNLIIEFLKLPELSQQNYREVRQFLSLKEDQVLELLAGYQKDIVAWNSRVMQQILLKEHITNNSEKALKAVIAMLNSNTSEDNERLVKVAIEAGNWTTVLSLLKSESLQNKPKSKLLKTMIKQAQIQPSLNHEYQSCLLQLLKDQENCVNQYDDHHNTPLHYAVLYRNEIAIKELLRQGARLGLSSSGKRLPIEDMDVKLLEEHFDYCITSRGKKPSHEQYEIIMNCLNLTNRHKDLDIAPIVCMAKSKELCPLLQHPLITCFLLLKWQRLSTVFYTHFLIFILLSASLVAHVVLRFPQRIHYELPILILSTIIFCLIGYILIVELSNYLMTHKLPSYVSLPLVTLLILNCIEWGENLETQRIYAVFVIMLMAFKLTILIGALPFPSISTHMLMLRQVTSNFLKCLAQYSILIFTFGLCFYIIFGSPIVADSFLSYSHPDTTLMKTLVMFTGEYDENDFTGYYTSIVLIIFMFMTMILTNLLGGLAVNDTQNIQAKVELNAAICRTNLLNSYEGILKGHWGNSEWLRVVFQKLMHIQTDCSYGYLSIFPNQDNRAEVYNQRHRNQSIESLPNSEDVCLSPLYPDCKDDASSNDSNMGNYEYLPTNFDAHLTDFEINSNWSKYESIPKDMNALKSNLKIDNATVKRALQIIKEKSNKEIEEKREEFTEKRLENIWNLLKELKNELAMKKLDN